MLCVNPVCYRERCLARSKGLSKSFGHSVHCSTKASLLTLSFLSRKLKLFAEWQDGMLFFVPVMGMLTGEREGDSCLTPSELNSSGMSLSLSLSLPVVFLSHKN